MNFEKLLEQEAQRAALQDYEEVTEKTKNYSYKFSKEFIQKMNKMIYEEKRKAKKKRRLRFLLVAAVILILNAGIVLANDDLRVLKISSNKLILVLIRDAMLGVTFSGLMQSVA